MTKGSTDTLSVLQDMVQAGSGNYTDIFNSRSEWEWIGGRPEREWHLRSWKRWRNSLTFNTGWWRQVFTPDAPPHKSLIACLVLARQEKGNQLKREYERHNTQTTLWRSVYVVLFCDVTTTGTFLQHDFSQLILMIIRRFMAKSF